MLGNKKEFYFIYFAFQIGMIREDHLLRKRVRQFYVIKAICLHKQNCQLDDLIEFANIQAQINDKEKR